MSPVSRTRNNFACIDNGNSPTSSKKMVPPEATSNNPVRAESAPVNAPLQWPNSSDSIRCSGNAPQLIGTNGCSDRSEALWTARATNSLPHPGLTADQHGRFGRCDLGNQFFDRRHR